MRVYHFTATHHAAGIARDGEMHGGVIPIPSADGQYLDAVEHGWQWLTTDPTWRQSWATALKADCDRTEVRLTIEIPLVDLSRLKRWDAVAPEYGYTPPIAERFAKLGGGSGDTSSWRVFRGSLPADWITAVDARPADLPSLVPPARARRGAARCGRR